MTGHRRSAASRRAPDRSDRRGTAVATALPSPSRRSPVTWSDPASRQGCRRSR